MPSTAVSYPGVYIREIPSGVHAIVGVATSITAFLGRAASGPVDEARDVFSLNEFQRTFGPVHPDYPMSFAVRDFFTNGGTHALVVRLFKPVDAPSRRKVTASASLVLDASNNLVVRAKSPGKWANAYYVQTDRAGIDDLPAGDAEALRKQLGVTDLKNVYNLYVGIPDPNDVDHVVKGVAAESFLNVTNEVKSLRRIDLVLADESGLIDVDMPPVETAPTGTASQPLAGGDDSANLQAAADYYLPGDDTYGLGVMSKVDLFNILCIPPDTLGGALLGGSGMPDFNDQVLQFCQQHRAFYIIDSDPSWDASEAAAARFLADPKTAMAKVATVTPFAANGAIFYPRIVESVQVDRNTPARSISVSPCGAIAGIFARTDAQRGVWKAPAGTGPEAAIRGATDLAVKLTDQENGILNPLAINCLRDFRVAGRVVWGARTLRGADAVSDIDNKYIPVRRFTLFLEESLYRSTQWAVFEPNDEPLWGQLRMEIRNFLQGLFLQHAFAGKTPDEAYRVQCDDTTTTPDDINLGIVNVLVGFAPLKPAEFVVIKLQQSAGRTAP